MLNVTNKSPVLLVPIDVAASEKWALMIIYKGEHVLDV